MKKHAKNAIIALVSCAFVAGTMPAEANHPVKRAVKAIIGLPICLGVGIALGVGTGALVSLSGPALWLDLVRTDAALDRLEDEMAAREAAKAAEKQ